MKHYICNCTAFPWPHALGLSAACANQVNPPIIPRSLLKDTHDFRDTGAPAVKNYPYTDWRSWERRP
jgi:hypothetical protein